MVYFQHQYLRLCTLESYLTLELVSEEDLKLYNHPHHGEMLTL